MTIQNELVELMERKGLSQTQVARAIGMSPATVSTWLRGNYAGRSDEVAELVSALISRMAEKDKQQRIKAEFVATSTSKKAMELITLAHVDGEINVLYGEAGLGKTMTVKAYVAKHRDAILIEADPGYTARVVLEELSNKLGLTVRGNMHELSEACINKLMDSGRVLIIDEAENLPYRALESIRRIHDKTGIGVVLVGMPRLIINLKGKRGEFVQLYSRVAFALNIGNALPAGDIDTIAGSLLPEDKRDELSDVLYQESKGNARRLFKLLRGVIRTSAINEIPVNAKAVHQFAQMLIN